MASIIKALLFVALLNHAVSIAIVISRNIYSSLAYLCLTLRVEIFVKIWVSALCLLIWLGAWSFARNARDTVSHHRQQLPSKPMLGFVLIHSVLPYMIGGFLVFCGVQALGSMDGLLETVRLPLVYDEDDGI